MTPFARLVCIGLPLLLISLTCAVSFGAVAIPVEQVWSIILYQLRPELVEPAWSAGRESIVWQVRLPRALLAMLVGAGLSVVGATLQPATRNPLADPHLLGVSSGAALGAVVALMHTGLILGLITVPLFAFVGALGATGLVLLVSRFADAASADRLVLAGVAVSFVILALANLLIFLGDPRAVHTVVFWMLGGLGLAQWSHLIYPLAALAGCLAYLVLRASHLNALAMGDETATSLGIPVARFRLTIFAIAALLTGVVVAFSGAIGFIGLMVPHAARLLLGGDSARVIPGAALLGAIALLWADIVARTLVAPEDMPIGIVTGLAGGLFFILLLRRR
jgi:iron complex transport system permease protein